MCSLVQEKGLLPRKRHKRGSFKTLRLPKVLRFYNQPKLQRDKLSVRTFLTLRRDERPGTRGLCSGEERSHRSCQRRPAVPRQAGPATPGGRGDAGRRAGGSRVGAGGSRRPAAPDKAQPGRQPSSSGVARGNGEVPEEGSGSACAKNPTEGMNATFLGGFLARQGGKVPPSLHRSPAPGVSPRQLRKVPGGARRSPPGAAVRGLPPSRGCL